jgi:hypothetical protein
MKLKKWLFIPGAALIIASCGENSTTQVDSNTDSTASANATNTDKNNNNSSSPSTTTSVEVPSTIKTNFETKYPSASNVTWTNYYEPYSDIYWDWTGWPAMNEKDYTVHYNMDGTDYYTWYDENGDWIATTNVVSDVNSLPARVNSAIKKDFDGYTIKSAHKENDKNREAYELKLEKGSDKVVVLVTPEGTILKKKGSIDGDKVKEKTDVK